MRRIEGSRHHLVDRCGLMLAQDNFLEFLVLFSEEDKVLEKVQQVRHRAEALHLCFEVANLFMLPIES